MQKPFKHNFNEYSVKLLHLEDCTDEQRRAKKEIEQFIKHYETLPSPYQPRREWVFKDLQELINFRSGKN